MTTAPERPIPPVGSRRAGTVVACVAVLMLASCAPQPIRVAPVDAGGRVALYRSRLAGREVRARMAMAEVTLWPRDLAACDTCPPLHVPAVQAELAVLAPEALRLRVRSAFGTAVDLALRGDSLEAFAPGPGLALVLDVARGNEGLSAPGRVAARLVSAAWRPPVAARSAWRDGGLDLLWREDRDSLAVTVDEAGLPAAVRMWRGAGVEARVRYMRWEAMQGVAWPMAWSVEVGDGGARLDCRVERVTFAELPDPARVAVRIPPDARRVGMDELRHLLGVLGQPR